MAATKFTSSKVSSLPVLSLHVYLINSIFSPVISSNTLEYAIAKELLPVPAGPSKQNA